MRLQLAPKGPPVWFLGEPRKIRVSLSFQTPGPVEIDFTTLTLKEQKQVLHSLRLGHITSDVPLAELLSLHEQTQPKEAPPPPVQQYLAKQEKENTAALLLKQKATKEQKDQQLAERCAYLVKQSVKAIKAVVSKSEDTRFLRVLLTAEKEAKARATVVSYIEEQIRKVQYEVALKMEQAAKQPPLKLAPEPGATFSKDVIDSESRLITLSEQDLIDLAAGRRLGGEP